MQVSKAPAKNMNLQFKLGELTIDKKEAEILLQNFGKDETPSVCLSSLLDRKKLDPNKVFQLSIETKNPQLASLAAKMEINGFKPIGKIKRTYKRSVRILDINKAETRAIDNVIETLLTSKTQRSVGAAMILHNLRHMDTRTLRNIAAQTVTFLAEQKEVFNGTETVFKGFKRDSTGYYTPKSKDEKTPRKDTYHASRMYAALREGAAYLIQTGMAQGEEFVTFGSEEKELDKNSMHLQRTVYRFKLTTEGLNLIRQWGDCKEYIIDYWKQQDNTALAAS